MRRVLKTGDRDITKQAQVVYRAAFNGETLPSGWRVIRFNKRCRWYGHSIGNYGLTGAAGRCAWDIRTIMLHKSAWHGGGLHSQRAIPGSSWLGVLIHEFIHMRCPRLKHGTEFNQLTAAAYERVWQDPH